MPRVSTQFLCFLRSPLQIGYLLQSSFVGRLLLAESQRFHAKGVKEEPCGDPLVCSIHALCTSYKFTWFPLSSKKDRMRFEDASEKPYALRFWIIKAGYSESNVLLIWVDNSVTLSLLLAVIFWSSTSLIKVVSQQCCFLYAAISWYMCESMVAITFLKSNDSHTLSTELRTVNNFFEQCPNCRVSRALVNEAVRHYEIF